MKRKLTYATFAVAAMILTGFLMDRRAVVWGQDAAEAASGEADAVILVEENSVPIVSRRRLGLRRTPDAEIRKAIQSYQAAKSDLDKQTAKEAVSTALAAYFEADMKNREQDIKQIEERVKKLRDQLEKRRAAKAKIVDLQLQVLINEAEGLGFYGGPKQNSPLGRSRSPLPRTVPSAGTILQLADPSSNR